MQYTLFVLMVATARAEDPLLDLIALQQKTLTENGITVYYETAKIQTWGPPQIKSKWATNRISDKDEKARLEAQFELGQKLLGELPNMMTAAETIGVHKSVQQLMAFADWMASKSCYGNALIARRAFDLALSLAGPLAADQRTTDETLASLHSSLAPKWATVTFASAVLDDEAGATIFSASKTSDDLRLIWADGFCKAIEAKDPALAKSLRAGLIPTTKPSSAKMTNELLSLFIDDQMPPKPSTEALLSGKHHEILVTGIEPANALRLRNLLTFRRELKTFPDDSVKSDFYPGLKGAFDETWRRHFEANKPQGLSIKLGLAAWATYDAIKQRQFRPEEE